jgi:hypothetical protein
MIGVEMGHDDLMVTDELFQDDEYDDHTYHNEYGPGGWNSIMMADDDNKHNWKAIHIVQIRVAFDQPLYVNNGTKIAEMGDLDGLTRLRCGRDLVESHCGILGREIPKRNASASNDFKECDHGPKDFAITRVATNGISANLIPSLTHSVTATISQSLTRSPRTDFYCWYCKHEKVYCSYCHAGMTAASATDYYGSYYAEYYSRYYAYWYGSVLGDGFVDDVLGL